MSDTMEKGIDRVLARIKDLVNFLDHNRFGGNNGGI